MIPAACGGASFSINTNSNSNFNRVKNSHGKSSF
jgi:hypothetical protein